jgi:CelD/BcsL family acetyltransferase involved in cellulose biosynthesis
VLPGRELGTELLQGWLAILQSNRRLESPFFRPEYTQAVASVRDDVLVAVAFQGEEPVAFFPFQRNAWKAGSPVGGPLTDYQGIVARSGTVIEPRQLLRACGLASWRFDHLLAAQAQFAPYRLLDAESPCIDLSCGLAQYLQQHRKCNDFCQTERLARKIQREIGPLRLELESCDRDVLNRLIQWKSQQYRQTRTPDIFQYAWVRQVVERLLDRREPGFSASISTLSVHGEILAIFLGLRSGDVCHSWMTTYNRDYARYSPGRMLHLELVKAAPELGIRAIDLGRGREQYKHSFANSAIPLWEGVVERRPLTRWFRTRWLHAREWVRDSRYADAIRVPWSWVRPLRDWMKYR